MFCVVDLLLGNFVFLLGGGVYGLWGKGVLFLGSSLWFFFVVGGRWEVLVVGW